MSKDKIVEILKKRFGSVYCNTCKCEMDDDACDFCHRKYMNWGINDEYAEMVAEEIIRADDENVDVL